MQVSQVKVNFLQYSLALRTKNRLQNLLKSEDHRVFSDLKTVVTCSKRESSTFCLDLGFYAAKIKDFCEPFLKTSIIPKVSSSLVVDNLAQFYLNTYCNRLRLFEMSFHKRNSELLKESLFLPRAKKGLQKRNSHIIADKGLFPRIAQFGFAKGDNKTDSSHALVSTVFVDETEDDVLNYCRRYLDEDEESENDNFLKRMNTFNSEESSPHSFSSSPTLARSRGSQ